MKSGGISRRSWMKRSPGRKSLAERFDSKWVPEPNTGCHLWTGALNSSGYGSFSGKERRAHRYAWVAKHGPIPAGLVVDHTCRVRSCVNPDHMRIVTPRTNTLENSESVTAKHARKTHCPKCGAEYRCRPGMPHSRYCLSCRLARSSADGRKYFQRKRRKNPTEWDRVYGSKARVAWVKSLPCAASSPRCSGVSQNAHTANGGMGRKADANTIVPLCDFHHGVLHNKGVASFEARFGVALKAEAAHVAAEWDAIVAARGAA